MATTVILGAGDLGGAIARHLAAADVVSSITLVDEAETVAQGKALDIRQAAPVDRFVTALYGTASLDAVIDADFIVIADRLAAAAEWQDDAAVNLLLRIAGYNSTAPLVCAGASHATLVERAVRELGLPRHRAFGTAPEALRSAIAAITALEAESASTDVSLSVVGRPPGQIIVSWEHASIAGRSATSVLSPPALGRIEGRLPRLWPPGPLTLAAAAARAIACAVTRTPRTLSAFVAVPRDQGPLHGVGMLPITVTTRGVGAVLTPALSTRDKVRLETALSS